MQSPQNQRAENLKATIGSLNDELLDTNRAIEKAHIEKDRLSGDIAKLSEESKGLKQDIKYQEGLVLKLQQDKQEYEKQIGIQVIKLQSLAEDMDAQKLRLQEGLFILAQQLQDKKDEIIKESNDLNIIKSGIALAKRELTHHKQMCLTVEKDIRQNTRKLGTITEQLSRKNDIKEEYRKLAERIKIVEKRERELVQNTKSNASHLGERERDVRIVTARLKKLWPKDVPFPKLLP